MNKYVFILGLFICQSFSWAQNNSLTNPSFPNNPGGFNATLNTGLNFNQPISNQPPQGINYNAPIGGSGQFSNVSLIQPGTPITPAAAAPAVQLPDPCQQAMQAAQAECSSGTGLGAQAATMLQTQAGQLIQQQEMQQEMQAAQGNSVTVVNVTNQPAQNTAANAACNASKTLGGVNMVAGLLEATVCFKAHAACYNQCTPSNILPVIYARWPTLQLSDDGQTHANNLESAEEHSNEGVCDNSLHTFETSVLPQQLGAVMATMVGANCKNTTTASANPPPLPVPPAMPPADQVGNQGLQPFPVGSAGPAPFPEEAGGAAGGALGTTGYPGGPPDKPAQANAASGIANPALGLSNGSGGGGMWPSGGGTMQNGKGAAPFDLSALLPGKEQDPNRAPASVSEVTGANDLTNFQKVTRMMNKKRPVLKAGDGA